MNAPTPHAKPAPSPLADPISRRRTFAIISHPDAGKTTLTEKLLLFGGAIQLAGQVRAKRNATQTRSDWMSIERERGISVVTSVMTFEYGGCVFNLLDTPGHEDFSEDTYRTLSAVDAAVMVHRRGQGHRGAHAKTVRGVPAARYSDRHLHQQARPRGRATRSNCSTRSKRRWRSTPPPSPGRSAAARLLLEPIVFATKSVRKLDKDDQLMTVSGLTTRALSRCCRRSRPTPGARRRNSRKRRAKPFDLAAFSRGPSDAGVFSAARCAISACAISIDAMAAHGAAAARSSRPTSARSRPTSPR